MAGGLRMAKSTACRVSLRSAKPYGQTGRISGSGLLPKFDYARAFRTNEPHPMSTSWPGSNVRSWRIASRNYSKKLDLD